MLGESRSNLGCSLHIKPMTQLTCAYNRLQITRGQIFDGVECWWYVQVFTSSGKSPFPRVQAIRPAIMQRKHPRIYRGCISNLNLVIGRLHTGLIYWHIIVRPNRPLPRRKVSLFMLVCKLLFDTSDKGFAEAHNFPLLQITRPSIPFDIGTPCQ